MHLSVYASTVNVFVYTYKTIHAKNEMAYTVSTFSKANIFTRIFVLLIDLRNLDLLAIL